jgi:hypothetical protein
MAGLSVMTGCSSSTTSGVAATSGTAAPMLVTVSDAPLNNILSAKVTISAMSVGTSGASSSLSVLSQPVTVELSSLGGIQEPIELTNLAYGTYNKATVTVSSAQVTYLDANGHVATGTATITQPTVTVALNPALVVNSSQELHLQFGFNLSNSFDLTGSTLSFTPAVNTVAAVVSKEDGGDRELEATGTVVSASATSITVQCGDSGRQFTYVINGATALPNGLTVASLQKGTLVRVQGQTQADGTLLAVSITPASGMGGQHEDGAKGIITAVTQDNTGAVSGFTMVPREGFGTSQALNSVTVALSSATVYGVSHEALQAGLTSGSFTNAELFVGQSVMVGGAADSTGTVNAQQVTLCGEGLGGTLAAALQGSSPDFTLGLTVTNAGYIGSKQAWTLNVVTGQNTEYDHGLTAAAFAALAAGSQLEVNGYLLRDGSGNFTLYAKQIGQVQAPETPEAPESGS